MKDEEKSKAELIRELRALRESHVELREFTNNAAAMTEQLHGMLEEIPVMIAFIDSGQRYAFCNKAYRNALGLARDQLLGKTLRDVCAPELYGELSGYAEKALAGEPVCFETSTTFADGSEHLFRTSCVPHSGPGGGGGFFVFRQDMTEQKKVEEALRESEAWFSNLAENLPGISIQGYRTSGEVFYWNKLSEDVYGYAAREAIGKNLADLIVPDSLRPLFEQCLELGKKVTKSGEFMPAGELLLRHKQGHMVPVYSVHTAIYIKGKEPLLFCIDIDLSDRKRIEEELFNAKKLESIGILAGGIAHDFNNLIFVILGNISMAQMKLDASSPALRHLEEAEKACLRARDLTQKFITFSAGGGPRKKMASVRELIQDAITVVLSGSSIANDVRIDEELWTAYIDESQVRQALTAIMTNAREAMPRGGLLRVTAQNFDVAAMEKIALNLPEGGPYLKIVITDEGPGIPEENLTRIFDPYFSTKYRGSQKGMGFGLAIAHSVIKRHNGNIKVESGPGEGTTVTVLLPASPAPGGAGLAKMGSFPAGKRILVMDDDEMLGELTKTMLEHLGFEVGVARNGEQAIEMYAESLENNRPYDALVLDLTVKGGMGGKETIRKVLYLDPQARAIVSSGLSSDPIMSDFASHGFKGALSKPYAIEQLRDSLNEILEE